MDKKDTLIIALVVLLTAISTLYVSSGVRRAGGVTPYIADIFGSVGGE